jgi:site-specific DNA recombinase
VTAILANPRYTGRQVWNRQVRDHGTHPTGRKRRRPVQHWNPVQEWVISQKIVHPPLVTERDFVAAQAIRAARPTADGDVRIYLLAGLLRCGECGRRMDAHWVHGRPGYRCRHGHTSSRSPNTRRAKSLYVREDHVLARLPALLAGLDFQPSDSSTPTAGQDQIVAFLRTNNAVITCDVNGCGLLAASRDPEHGMTP